MSLFCNSVSARCCDVPDVRSTARPEPLRSSNSCAPAARFMASSPGGHIRVLCDVDGEVAGGAIPPFLFLTQRETLVGDLRVALSHHLTRKHPGPGLEVCSIHDCFTPQLTFLLDDSVRLIVLNLLCMIVCRST